MKKLLTILTAAMMMTTLAAAESGTPTDLGTPFADVTATPAPVEETVAPATEVPVVVTEVPATEVPVVVTEVPAAETEAPADEAAAARSVRIVAFGDAEDFYVGNRVGLFAELTGYEGLNVAVQWQRWDPTTETWEDIPGATNLALWIDTTVGMDGSMWQVVVTIL
ncbi:MAG: hypothetical protein Q4B32_06715 [Clostridia bacterium]|nr:hypothetical protein [Clostridia bacterium]